MHVTAHQDCSCCSAAQQAQLDPAGRLHRWECTPRNIRSNSRLSIIDKYSQSGCRVVCSGQHKHHRLPAPAGFWVQQHANQGRHGASGGAVASHQLPDGQRGFDAHLGTPPAVGGTWYQH